MDFCHCSININQSCILLEIAYIFYINSIWILSINTSLCRRFEGSDKKQFTPKIFIYNLKTQTAFKSNFDLTSVVLIYFDNHNFKIPMSWNGCSYYYYNCNLILYKIIIHMRIILNRIFKTIATLLYYMSKFNTHRNANRLKILSYKFVSVLRFFI